LADRIFIEGIKFHGYHGLTKSEREIGVRLAVDVSIELDLEASGRSDRVADTLDYRGVHERVMALGHGKSHFLLESFALQLIDHLLDDYPPAQQITVRVRKETPVLNGIVDSVGVELTRQRPPAAP
jgi:dihydroneopterin aldolase